MRFAGFTAVRNIKRRPFRSAGMALLVMLLSFALFGGCLTVFSLQKGLSAYQARLGADIVVVPSSATGHGTVDDILLQGITGNYYMTGKEVDKLKSIGGIGEMSTQFFLTSAKASCCSSRVQIIGFDPQTDFTILPWINESYVQTISDGDIVVGANISVPSDRLITFYGQSYRVAAQLARTGTGLDSAVYTNMNTVRQMAHDAARLLETSQFKGVSLDTAVSAVFIRVAEGCEIKDVTDDINIHITKVEATSSKSMVAQIAEGLGNVSHIIGLLVGAVCVLAVIILIAVHALLANERRKEFAILRIMGASRRMLFRIMGAEAAIISAVGAVIGLLLAGLAGFLLLDSLKNALGLPFFAPGAGSVIVMAVAVLIVSVAVGLLAALISSRRITKSETGLLLREDG